MSNDLILLVVPERDLLVRLTILFADEDVLSLQVARHSSVLPEQWVLHKNCGTPLEMAPDQHRFFLREWSIYWVQLAEMAHVHEPNLRAWPGQQPVLYRDGRVSLNVYFPEFAGPVRKTVFRWKP